MWDSEPIRWRRCYGVISGSNLRGAGLFRLDPGAQPARAAATVLLGYL
jgi:hypothetical protein